MIDPVEFSCDLIAEPSITPAEAKHFIPLEKALSSLGFSNRQMEYSEEGHPNVANLYATIGTGAPHLYFAGHLDVVPVGDASKWTSPAFTPTIRDEYLYGRGASDMKCAIACFVAALSKFLEETPVDQLQGSISLLITGDEEGTAINGTRKMLHQLETEKVPFGVCIVGEPTSVEKVGDTFKMGRRGSATFYITFEGKQGHVAYPQLAHNPITPLIQFLDYVKQFVLDKGNAFFDPSNLEIVELKSGTGADNVIPGDASATINVRFNNLQQSQRLYEWIDTNCKRFAADYHCHYTIHTRVSGESFINEPKELIDLIQHAVGAVTDYGPKPSTSGGTSDARFIKNYMPVIELGMLNATAHKIDEAVSVEDIHTLTAIYYELLRLFFIKPAL